MIEPEVRLNFIHADYANVKAHAVGRNLVPINDRDEYILGL